MAPHSSTLAWKIPWMEEPGRLQSMGSQRVGYDWATSLSLFTFHFHALEKEMATHFSVLAWRIPGTGEPGGLPSMGSHRVRHDWSDLAAAAAPSTEELFLGKQPKMFPDEIVFGWGCLRNWRWPFRVLFTCVWKCLCKKMLKEIHVNYFIERSFI